MAKKTPSPVPSRPPLWPDPVSVEKARTPPVVADPAPWWFCPWYDPAPPWWDRLEYAGKDKLVAAQLAYKRSELQAKLAYVDALIASFR